MSWKDILKDMTNRPPRQKAEQLKLAIARKKREIAVMEKMLAKLNYTPRKKFSGGVKTYQPVGKRRELEILLDKKFKGLITEEEYLAEKEKLQ